MQLVHHTYAITLECKPALSRGLVFLHHAADAFALLAASEYACCNAFWKHGLDCHRLTLQEPVSNSSSYVTSSIDGLCQSSSFSSERLSTEGEAEGNGSIKAGLVSCLGVSLGGTFERPRESSGTRGFCAASGVPTNDVVCDL